MPPMRVGQHVAGVSRRHRTRRLSYREVSSRPRFFGQTPPGGTAGGTLVALGFARTVIVADADFLLPSVLGVAGLCPKRAPPNWGIGGSKPSIIVGTSITQSPNRPGTTSTSDSGVTGPFVVRSRYR